MVKNPLHILLADDDESDRLIFTEALKELELNVVIHTVNNGMELMAYLAKDDITLPHLIFLDLNMPRKNGLECLKEIKEFEKLKDIAIAIYSTSDDEKDMKESFCSGANIYLTKPDDFDVLKQLLYKAVTTTHVYQDVSFNRANFLLKI